LLQLQQQSQPQQLQPAATASTVATSVSGGVDASKSELGLVFGNYNNMMAMGVILKT